MNRQEREMFCKFINTDEYSRISHIIVEEDFCTSHPNPFRIDRFAGEINGYLKQRRKLAVQAGGDKV